MFRYRSPDVLIGRRRMAREKPRNPAILEIALHVDIVGVTGSIPVTPTIRTQGP